MLSLLVRSQVPIQFDDAGLRTWLAEKDSNLRIRGSEPRALNRLAIRQWPGVADSNCRDWLQGPTS